MTDEDETQLIRAAERALSDLQVEREERPDGRYVLYFSWPAADAVATDPTERPADV